ncbi:MAG: nucleotidyltransferase domain-containing protein [Candidatus Terrybacteria bacterium]|nr:nucleotidyltransferase domain-containing protein [Candidatus Terrybacteria bacterium]
MRIEHYPPEKFKKQILEIIGKYLDLNSYQVFFFGSRVIGKGNERSDIDIGIKGPGPVSSKAWVEIQEEIENLPILYKIEIVDFSQTTPIFKKVALQHMEPIKI